MWTSRPSLSLRVGLVITLGVVCIVPATSSDAHASSASPPAMPGDLTLGNDVALDIDEHTGTLQVVASLASLAGVATGSTNLQLAYSHERALDGHDRFGVGYGWSWSDPYVDVDGSVRLHTAQGVFEASASEPSGLTQYPSSDVKFVTDPGELPARSGVPQPVPYTYLFAESGGVTSYFSHTGDIVARTDAFGNRVDWEWHPGDDHRLTAVINDVGSRVDVVWLADGLEVTTSPRSDGTLARTRIVTASGRVVAVINPVGETTTFGYETSVSDHLLQTVVTPSGAMTDIEYQSLRNRMTVKTVYISDMSSGVALAERRWNPNGEHDAYGWPQYAGERELQASGDGAYRYRTQMCDDALCVQSEYNALGLPVERQWKAAQSSHDLAFAEQRITYAGDENGHTFTPHSLSSTSARPVRVVTTYRDDAGRTRTTEQTMGYDSEGRLTEARDDDGTVTTMTHDDAVPEGLLVPIGLVREQVTRGTDGAMSRVVNTMTPDHRAIARTETFSSDSSDELVPASIVEKDTNSDGFISEERVIATTPQTAGPDTVVTRFDRIVADRTVSVTRTDAAGTSAQSQSSVVTDIVSGLVVGNIDALGRTSTTRYDERGRPHTHIDFAARTTLTEYGPLFTRAIDAAGVTRTEHRDAIGRMVRTTDNIRHGVIEPGFERVIETRAYDGSRVTVTDVHGRQTVTAVDKRGRVREIRGPSGIRTITDYDDVARTETTGTVDSGETMSDARQVSTSYHDDRGRVVRESTVRRDGVAVSDAVTGYDGLGRENRSALSDREHVTKRDSQGNPHDTTVSRLDRPDRTLLDPADMSSVNVTRSHNIFGMSTQKTLRSDNGVSHGDMRIIDAAGRVISRVDPLDRETRYTYSDDGLVERIQYPDGRETRNHYDSRTRVLVDTETRGNDGALVAQGYEHDSATDRVLAVYDPRAQETTRVSYEYDAWGNVTATTYPDGITMRRLYDETGRLAARVDAAGSETRYAYNDLGLLERVWQRFPDGSETGVAYQYDRFGRVVRIARSNDVTTEYTYTSADEIKTETTTRGEELIFHGSYDYDGHGNLTNRVERTDSEPGERTVTYGYDAYDRLVESVVHDAASAQGGDALRHTRYEIGVGGDVVRESVTRSGWPDVTRDFHYDESGQLLAISTDSNRVAQEFDGAGNLIKDVYGTQYSYDPRGNLVLTRNADGAHTAFSYWATGERRDATTSALTRAGSATVESTTGFYWDSGVLVNDVHSERDGGGDDETSIASYLLGGSRHSRTLLASDTRVLQMESLLADRHGNTIATLNSAGDVTERHEYGDYGEVADKNNVDKNKTSPSGSSYSHAARNPFRYSGEYTEPSGRQFLGSRVYLGEQMRFTSRDTAPQHNRYAYTTNPVTEIDPTGETPRDDRSLVLGLTIAGVAMSVVGTALFFPVDTFLKQMGLFFSSFLDLVQLSCAILVATLDLRDEAPNVAALSFIAGALTLANGMSANLAARGIVRVRGVRMNADRAAMASYKAQPNRSWDIAVGLAKSVPLSIRAPQIPRNHYFNPLLRSHPHYANTGYTGWVLAGKSRNQLGAATGLPRELTDEIARLADNDIAAVRRTVAKDTFDDDFGPRFNHGTADFDAQVTAALSIPPAPYRPPLAAHSVTPASPAKAGLRKRKGHRTNIELQEMF